MNSEQEDSTNLIVYDDSSREFWHNELEKFIPENIFDAHVHLWNKRYATQDTHRDNDWGDHNTGMKEQKAIAELLYPGRRTNFLAFSMPIRNANYDKLNSWVCEELKATPDSYGAILVTPEMSTQKIMNMAKQNRPIIALKPYYSFSGRSGSALTDYFPEAHMELAEELQLAVIVHLPCGPAFALPELTVFTEKYPHVQWVLAHCAGAFSAGQLDQAVYQLRDLPNIWYDTAVIRDVSTHLTLLKYENRKRILFGTDNALGIGGCRRSNATGHCGPGEIPRCYEQLLSQRLACEAAGASESEVESIFCYNFHSLLLKLTDF